MNRDQLRKVIGDAVGNPSSGSVADVLDEIAAAVDAALNPTAREKRVVAPEETRGE